MVDGRDRYSARLHKETNAIQNGMLMKYTPNTHGLCGLSPRGLGLDGEVVITRSVDVCSPPWVVPLGRWVQSSEGARSLGFPRMKSHHYCAVKHSE